MPISREIFDAQMKSWKHTSKVYSANKKSQTTIDQYILYISQNFKNVETFEDMFDHKTLKLVSLSLGKEVSVERWRRD